ncbi:MAG: hypothetical protein H6735_32480 [Alphaproteobacteria bacterium]|nr:hypothetical protein [Alphaproteobacteria bacterium]
MNALVAARPSLCLDEERELRQRLDARCEAVLRSWGVEPPIPFPDEIEPEWSPADVTRAVAEVVRQCPELRRDIELDCDEYPCALAVVSGLERDDLAACGWTLPTASLQIVMWPDGSPGGIVLRRVGRRGEDDPELSARIERRWPWRKQLLLERLDHGP